MKTDCKNCSMSWNCKERIWIDHKHWLEDTNMLTVWEYVHKHNIRVCYAYVRIWWKFWIKGDKL